MDDKQAGNGDHYEIQIRDLNKEKLPSYEKTAENKRETEKTHQTS